MKTIKSCLKYDEKKYSFFRSGGPEKYLNEIIRLENAIVEGIEGVEIETSEKNSRIIAISEEIKFLDSLIIKSILTWGDSYTMHIKIAGKFKDWCKKRNSNLIDRVIIWGPKKLSRQNKTNYVNDTTNEEVEIMNAISGGYGDKVGL